MLICVCKEDMGKVSQIHGYENEYQEDFLLGILYNKLCSSLPPNSGHFCVTQWFDPEMTSIIWRRYGEFLIIASQFSILKK